MKIEQPLRVRIVAATMCGVDLFGTEEIIIHPGESVTWSYPAGGLPVNSDVPVRMTA